MSNLITPYIAKPQRRNVQIADLRVLVLIHKDTNRVLCFGRDDKATRAIARKSGCKVVEILHAHEYDKYAKLWREQQKEETAIEDHIYLERENATRQVLRKQLRDKLPLLQEGADRQALESALRLLDQMEKRKQRYRAESFMVQEAFEASKTNVGEELIEKLMVPKKAKNELREG